MADNYKKNWVRSSFVFASLTFVAIVIGLSGGAVDSTIVSDSSNSITKEHSFLSPPLKDVNVPFEIYDVNGKEGEEIFLECGSEIIIPPNAFVDEKGRIIKGEVEIHYREFKDPIDFFVSGIPMTYDSAGTTYQFESAGMMEVVAYKNGKEVFVAPDKKIDIYLASSTEREDFNLYKLDVPKNNWTCLGKDKVVKKNDEARVISYTPSITKAPALITLENQETLLKETIKNEKESVLISIPKPKAPVKVNNDKFVFNIDVDKKEYPELAIYKDVLFEVGDENKNFDKSAYNVVWDDAKIKAGNVKGENYILVLEKNKRKKELVVYPVFEGKGLENAKIAYQEKLNTYNKLHSIRLKEEQQIEAQYEVMLANIEKQKQKIIEARKQKSLNTFNAMTTEEKIQRVFAINSFGIYNCDNPIAYPQGVACIASLQDENENELLCYGIYLVDSEKNALFNYYKNPVTKFTYNPNSKNILWTVNNGEMYWCDSANFASLKPVNGEMKITMQKVNQKFTSPAELKSFLKI